MKKSEIKQSIKSIKESIEEVRKNIEEIFKPYESIKRHLDSIEEIENEVGIDCGIDYEGVLCNIVRSSIEDSEYMEEVSNQFEYLISDLESWLEDVGERKQEQIQEQYIDVLVEIKDGFDIDIIECEEDLDNQLFDMINVLDDMEI